MAFDFRRKRDSADKRRQTPNPFSARARFRWFVAIAVVFVVWMVVDRFQDPGFRQMLGKRPAAANGDATLRENESADKKVNTALHPQRDEDTGEIKLSLQETPRAEVLAPDVAEKDATPVQRAWFDGWWRVYRQLKPVDQDLLMRGLKVARERRTLDASRHEAFADLQLQLEGAWSDYRDMALRSVKDAPVNEQEGWRDVVKQLEKQWNEQWSPTLSKLTSSTLTDDERQRCEQLQAWFDRLTLAEINDDTPMRANEREPWFRFFEMLAATPDAELRRWSKGPVGFLPLFEQPQEYRGKLVTVRGSALNAYHVRAPKNVNDVPGYYVFVLLPAGGPDSPILVYSLDTPPGFPKIFDKDVDRKTTDLREEVEFVGYFFKRLAYSSKGGVHTAPLLLAKAPHWTPAPKSEYEIPSVWKVAAIVLGTAAAGIAVAYVVYRQSLER